MGGVVGCHIYLGSTVQVGLSTHTHTASPLGKGIPSPSPLPSPSSFPTFPPARHFEVVILEPSLFHPLSPPSSSSSCLWSHPPPNQLRSWNAGCETPRPREGRFGMIKTVFIFSLSLSLFQVVVFGKRIRIPRKKRGVETSSILTGWSRRSRRRRRRRRRRHTFSDCHTHPPSTKKVSPPLLTRHKESWMKTTN